MYLKRDRFFLVIIGLLRLQLVYIERYAVSIQSFDPLNCSVACMPERLYVARSLCLNRGIFIDRNELIWIEKLIVECRALAIRMIHQAVLIGLKK